MVGESKIGDERFWEKWRKSGAVGEAPETRERREKEARAWVEEEYRFDTQKIAPEDLEDFLKRWDHDNEEDRAKEGWDEAFAKIKAHPELTPEEAVSYDSHEKYGITNNFWNSFFPGVAQKIRESLNNGEIPRYKPIFYWQQRGFLMQAFERVGFSRVKRMHEALVRYGELVIQAKEITGEKNGYMAEAYLASDTCKASKKIPPEIIKEYRRVRLEVDNTLRVLAIELGELGVAFKMIFA